MTYKFKFRRPWRLLWKSFEVAGHSYVRDQNKMVLFFPDGSQREIARWRSCEVYLGTDWVLAMKKDMETKAGQPVVLAIGGQ